MNKAAQIPDPDYTVEPELPENGIAELRTFPVAELLRVVSSYDNANASPSGVDTQQEITTTTKDGESSGWQQFN